MGKRREPAWGIIDFDEWLAQRPRSQAEIDLYHRVIDGLERLGATKDGELSPSAKRHLKQ